MVVFVSGWTGTNTFPNWTFKPADPDWGSYYTSGGVVSD